MVQRTLSTRILILYVTHAPEEILILSGDHVYNMDYQDLIDYHTEKDADLTIAFTRVPQSDAHRFGLAEIEETVADSRGGKILNYWEKPVEPQSNWAFNDNSLF